jgi:hypothetical protein
MGKTLVLFVFHEWNNRVEHFINRAIFQKDTVDFMIICNNPNITFKAPPYVRILFRSNIGYDFGGWSDALLTNDLYKQYDSFIFCNSSIIGPFLPSYYQGTWVDIYLAGLSDTVRIFGSSINTIESPKDRSHVQTYMFAVHRNTLDFLIESEIFTMNHYAKTMQEAIDREISLSRKVIKNGWNIGSLVPCYKGIDFTFRNKSPEEYSIPCYNDLIFNHYYNILWNQYDLVFIKGNRGIPVSYANGIAS